MKLLLSVASLLLSVPAANAGTWTVATTSGPGVDFTSIQRAIDKAVDGDLILVQPGSFAEQLHIDGKALTLQGVSNFQLNAVNALGTVVDSSPMLHVENLGAGQQVFLRNFSIARISSVPGESITLENNAGQVRIEHCFVDTYNGTGLHVLNSSDVVLNDAFLQVNTPVHDGQGTAVPKDGAVVEAGSSVRMFDVNMLGSHGAGALGFVSPVPVDGGNALTVHNSNLELIRCSLQGGSSGTIAVGGCLTGAIGGSAIEVADGVGAASQIFMRGTVKALAGSTAGFDPGCAPDPGVAPIISDPGQTIVQLPGVVRAFFNPGVQSPTQETTFVLDGGANDAYLIFASPAAISATPLPGFDGALFIDPQGAVAFLSGNLNPFGKQSLAIDFPSIGSPTVIFTQALFADSQARLWLSGPSTLFLE